MIYLKKYCLIIIKFYPFIPQYLYNICTKPIDALSFQQVAGQSISSIVYRGSCVCISVCMCVWEREESWTIAHGRVSQAAWQHTAWMQFVWDSWMNSARHHEVKSPTVQKRVWGTGQRSVGINKLYSSREFRWDVSMIQTSGARGLKQTLCNTGGYQCNIMTEEMLL